MARIRSIKPKFFIDHDIWELEPQVRLFYIGLWCLADREGRLEDKPDEIGAQLIPYDRQLDPENMLVGLTPKFIIRYEAGGCRCIQVRNFSKHQRPSASEADSVIPAPTMEQMDMVVPEDTQTTIKNVARRLKTAGDEKNRQEGKGKEKGKGEGKGGANAFSLPSWIDPVIWSNYCEMRVKIRKPMTEAAKGLIVGKLEGFKNMGHPANEVLKQSIEKSWTGVFPLKDGANGYPGATLGPSGLHKVNPADAYLSEMSRLDKVEAFHAEHTKGGKCAFCGKDLPKFGICDCEAYLKAWREVEAKEATCQLK